MQTPESEFVPVSVSELSGSCGPYHITLLGGPALRSTRTGVLKPIEEVREDDGEGGWEVITPAFYVSMKITFACCAYTMKLKEYLPRFIYQCRDCQSRLPEEPQEPCRFEFEVRPLDLPEFRVRLDAPACVLAAAGTTCCGRTTWCPRLRPQRPRPYVRCRTKSDLPNRAATDPPPKAAAGG